MIKEGSIALKLTYIGHQGFTKYFLIMLFKLKNSKIRTFLNLGIRHFFLFHHFEFLF